jgi:hypothetical protein
MKGDDMMQLTIHTFITRFNPNTLFCNSSFLTSQQEQCLRLPMTTNKIYGIQARKHNEMNWQWTRCK